jgi:hypothetical protein
MDSLDLYHSIIRTCLNHGMFHFRTESIIAMGINSGAAVNFSMHLHTLTTQEGSVVSCPSLNYYFTSFCAACSYTLIFTTVGIS